eukprot:scaffold33736_cov42-Cyclotella_meneghiniana.AAC.1
MMNLCCYHLSLLLAIGGSITVSALLSPNARNHRRTLTILTDRNRSPSRRRRRIRRGPKHYYEDDTESPYDFDVNCPIRYTDEPIDHAGLSKSIDDEYAAEEAKRGLTFWQILDREKYRVPSEFSADMSPYERAKRRMDFVKGNIESKYECMAVREYGNPDLLDKDHLNNPPTLDDLNQTPASFKSTYWSQPVFRTIDPKKFNVVVNQLGPNVGVLYATILALTLGVLYNRFCRIQENVTTEASLLSSLTRNLLTLFQDEPRWATDACQMIANQLRIMLSRTRGLELLSIMKADTYSNILALVDDYHYLHGCDDSFNAAQESTMGNIRADLTHIMEVRALRLSDEASSLPPTHFLLLTSLSTVSSIAFVTASLAVVDDLDNPPEEARLLFAGLAALYVLFFNFCRDLNGPFQGVYQIKRSNAVSHLLQTKWLIVNQLGDSVSFGEFEGSDFSGPNTDKEAVGLSSFDKMKRFLFGEDAVSEEITQLESDVMATLVKELDEHNQVDDLVKLEDDTLSSGGNPPDGSGHNQLDDKSSFSGASLSRIVGSNHQQDADVNFTDEMTLSLDFNYESGRVSNPITVTHGQDTDSNNRRRRKTKDDSQQFDYAAYFRNAGGFSS